MTPLLSVQQITAGYGNGVDVLCGVSMDFSPAGITGVIGLNGSGKTTLMKTIYGFLRPRSGRMLLRGEEINGSPPYLMLALGLWYIPQDSGLFPYLTVEDNLKVLFPAIERIRGPSWNGSGALQVAYDAFPVLHRKRKDVAGNLSGGERKMLEIAKALRVAPSICLIDEPTVGLAPKLAEVVYGRIRDLASAGVSIVLVDHNIGTVMDMADYFYVLHLGGSWIRAVPVLLKTACVKGRSPGSPGRGWHDAEEKRPYPGRSGKPRGGPDSRALFCHRLYRQALRPKPFGVLHES